MDMSTKAAANSPKRKVAIATIHPQVQDDSQVVEILLLLYRTFSAISDAPVFADQGIGLEGWAVLSQIKADKIPPLQIAKDLRISRRRIARVLSSLAEFGLVEVSAPPGGDRRSRTVSLLPKGVKLLEEISMQLHSSDSKPDERLLGRGRRTFRAIARVMTRTQHTMTKSDS